MTGLVTAAVIVSGLLNGPGTAETGDLLLYRAEEGSAVQSVAFMEKRYPPLTIPGGTGRYFLLGVDLEADGGVYGLSARREDGGDVDAGEVTVVKGTFPVEELQLPPKMVTPPPETLERISRERKAAAAVYRSTTADILWQPPFQRPVDGRGKGNFGRRRILNGIPKSPHSGEDFSASRGTPVRAVAAGIVDMAEDLYYSGNTILIDHGGGLVSQYFHLHELRVEKGISVARGDIIGTAGDTGRVTGPHLHFGLRLHSMRVDPSQLWDLFKSE